MNKKRLITGLVLIGALLVSVSVVYAIAYYENDDFDRGDVSLLGNAYWASDRDDYIVAESAGDGFYKTFPTQQKQEDAWDVYVYVQDKDAGAFALVELYDDEWDELCSDYSSLSLGWTEFNKIATILRTSLLEGIVVDPPAVDGFGPAHPDRPQLASVCPPMSSLA